MRLITAGMLEPLNLPASNSNSGVHSKHGACLYGPELVLVRDYQIVEWPSLTDNALIGEMLLAHQGV